MFEPRSVTAYPMTVQFFPCEYIINMVAALDSLVFTGAFRLLQCLGLPQKNDRSG